MLSREASRIIGKRSNIFERGSSPYNGFFGYRAVYKTLYVLSIVAQLPLAADGSPGVNPERPQLSLSVGQT